YRVSARQQHDHAKRERLSGPIHLTRAHGSRLPGGASCHFAPASLARRAAYSRRRGPLPMLAPSRAAPALLARVCTFGLLHLRAEGVEIENQAGAARNADAPAPWGSCASGSRSASPVSTWTTWCSSCGTTEVLARVGAEVLSGLR